MRTIDFRGKAVGSGRWIHGDLVLNGRTPAIFEDANQENGCITVKESTLGMNTGLKDKHGHEIYNGGRATTFSTPTRTVAPTTHGLPRTCLSVLTTCVMRNRLQWYVFL